MMIAIVILGLGLVMTATMFPVAWTRARTLTEYTTQRVVAQSAAATLAESLCPSGSSYMAFPNAATPTGVYMLSTGGLAGDLFYDPVLHTDPVEKLDCFPPPGACFAHRSVLIPSDTRVHALNMQNLLVTNSSIMPEDPWILERNDPWGSGQAVDLRASNFPISDFHAWIPVSFNSVSYYSPQVGVGARMYPPMEDPPTDAAALTTWQEKFGSRRFSWAVLHRLRHPVGPVNIPGGPLSISESNQYASQAAAAAGTTRTFDFYVVTLKRGQSTSRYAVQNSDPTLVPDWNNLMPASIAAQPIQNDLALPVAWRVQIEVPANMRRAAGPTVTPGDPTDDPTGVPTEVQVPPTGFGGSVEMMVGMFPSGSQFVDEINGQVFRVLSRRLSFRADGTIAFAVLTLDRELLLEDFDNSPQFGGDGQLQPGDALRIVWVFPPPVVERGTNDMPVFDDKTPVVGIDVRSISLTPPG